MPAGGTVACIASDLPHRYGEPANPGLLDEALGIFVIGESFAGREKFFEGWQGPGFVAEHSSQFALIRTAEAEFEILPSGYLHASRIQDGKLASLDDPQTGVGSVDGYPVVDGKPIEDFLGDLAQAKISEHQSRNGTRGKRIAITGSSPSRRELEKELPVDVYDDFPNHALVSVVYKNTGPSPVKLDRLVSQRHHFNASLADPKVPPYQLWSFQGASYEWGKETISMMKGGFSQSYIIGAMSPRGQGGEIPVGAF